MDCEANALIEPSVVGTIAIFDVTVPSGALSAEASGCSPVPCGQSVRNDSESVGMTVAVEDIGLRIRRGITTAACDIDAHAVDDRLRSNLGARIVDSAGRQIVQRQTAARRRSEVAVDINNQLILDIFGYFAP